MGTLEDFWELGDKAYESIDVKGYLKVPFSKNSKIYNDLTPQEALRKIRELQEAQKASEKWNLKALCIVAWRYREIILI